MGMALKTEEYETRVPRSQRGGEVIEPMLSEQVSTSAFAWRERESVCGKD